MRLRKWEIENYRSIRSAKFIPEDFTILIGRNNSGKSNILESIKEYGRLINDTPNDLASWFPRHVRGGDIEKTICFKFEFQLSSTEKKRIEDWIEDNYSTVDAENIFWERSFSYLRHVVEVGKHGLKLEKLQADIFGNWITVFEQENGSTRMINYDYIDEDGYTLTENGGKLQPKSGENRAYRESNMSNDIRATTQPPYQDIFQHFWENIEYISAIRRPQDRQQIRVQRELQSDATNLAPVLHTLSQNKKSLFNQIVEKYVSIMENVTDVRTPIEGSGQPQTTIEVDEEGAEDGFRLNEISSGSKEILSLITKIVLSQTDTSILLVEEPELHLHPGAEQEVYDLLKEVANESPQVIITTHSDVFVNQSDTNNILRIERFRTTTVVRRIEENEVGPELSDLGYDKSGLLQSEAVVFVEGKSDERTIKQFAQKCNLNLNRNGIELVELDGEGNIRSDGRSLVKLLSAFDIPYLFVVDSHGGHPKDVRDDILQHINSRKGEWHITPEHIHVWDGYGIEDFLIELPDAIQSVVGGEVDEIRQMIQNYEGENKAQVLNDIFEAELGEPYDKNQHGMLIAKQAEEESIPDEVKEVIEKIRKLPE